jgi:hypothetical protein
MNSQNAASSLDQPVALSNEFASVTVGMDYSGRGPRLLVTDAESGERVFLDPLQLSALCRATSADRQAWLRTGDYGDNPGQNHGPEHESRSGDHS